MPEHFNDKRGAGAAELLAALATFHSQLSADNPHAEGIQTALAVFCEHANPASKWERENVGGGTVQEQALLQLNLREMQRGRFWSNEAGAYIDPATGEPIDLDTENTNG